MLVRSSGDPASKSNYSGYHFARKFLLPTLRGKNDDLDVDNDSDNSSEHLLESWCCARHPIGHDPA